MDKVQEYLYKLDQLLQQKDEYHLSYHNASGHYTITSINLPGKLITYVMPLEEGSAVITTGITKYNLGQQKEWIHVFQRIDIEDEKNTK